MLEIIAFVIATVVLPVVINKSTESGRLDWIKPYLREIWTCIFVFFSLYLLQRPAAVEVVVRWHTRLPGLWGYSVAGVLGAFLLCSYWWFAGKMFAPTGGQAPPSSDDANKNLTGTQGSTRPPITKSDGFTILIPFDTANQNMPIPPDENPSDPHSRFYRDVLFLTADRPEFLINLPEKQSPKYLMQQRHQLFVEEDRPKFLARLIQMWIFDLVFHMTREGYGVELSGGRIRPLDDKAVIPPDYISTSTESLIADLSNRHLLTPRIEMSLKNFPLHMPKGTNVSFTERVDQKSGKAFAYITRMERPGFFRFDLTVQPMGSSEAGVLPDKFQTQSPKTVKTYSLIIAMESVIQVKNEDGFEPGRYAAWTQDTFSEIRRRMSF